MGGWVDGHFDIFDILLKPPQPFTGLFLYKERQFEAKYCIWTIPKAIRAQRK